MHWFVVLQPYTPKKILKVKRVIFLNIVIKNNIKHINRINFSYF